MEGIESSNSNLPGMAGVISVFPGLVPDDAQMHSYSGFIEVKVRPTINSQFYFFILIIHLLTDVNLLFEGRKIQIGDIWAENVSWRSVESNHNINQLWSSHWRSIWL